MGVLTGIFGDANEREIRKLGPLVGKISSLEAEFEKLSREELANKTAEFKKRLDQGAGLDDLLPEAFAAVREAAKRTLGQRHFDVQMLGGMALHRGKITEKKRLSSRLCRLILTRFRGRACMWLRSTIIFPGAMGFGWGRFTMPWGLRSGF